ncbi:MAG: EAL domain-containing protein [Chloroflexi bacterium]|nr:EAL domain-containing protein [Chloroflexota bacterium]
MTLRYKTLLATIAATLILAGLLSVASRAFLFRSYLQLEEKRVQSDLDVALSVLESQKGQLASFAQDWGAWDDTYLFANGENETYVETNLLDETFVYMRLNLFAVIRPDGELLYAKGFNLQALEEEAPPQGWQEVFSRHLDLGSFELESDARSEIVMLNGMPWLIAAHQVITSLYEGPVAGTLVVGRALNAAEMGVLSESLNMPVEIREYDPAALPDDYTAALAKMQASGSQKTALTRDEDWIAGYTMLSDNEGDLHLILRILEVREYYNHAKIFNRYFIAAVILIGIFISVTGNLVIDKNIIRRLDVIHRGIDQARTTKDLSTRISLPGNDEFSQLARKINQAFEALQNSQKALEENEQRLNHETLHDTLTRLPNRTFLLSLLTEILSQPVDGALTGVLFIDLDRFKLINDSYNHQTGDQILLITRDRILACLRPEDFLARMGGDEFAVVLQNLKTESEAVEAAARILKAFKTAFEINDRSIYLTASIGIATSKNARQADVLLRNADLAMNRAKASGKARSMMYNMRMHSDSLTLLQVESDLRRGIEQEEFVLHYQPIIRIDTGLIEAVEVLVRWMHPTRGLLFPGEFLPVAEETGLIVPLSEWIMVHAAQQWLRWHKQGHTYLNLAVNVPAQQLQDASFQAIIERYQPVLAEKCALLQVEISESTAMADYDLAQHNLARMREFGVRIAIDDFGTGYSSLSYLKRFPVDILKIDKSFLEQIEENATLLDAIIVMGHALGLQVTAEGVENEEQLEFLRQQGCDKAQGYLISRPVSAAIMENLLEQNLLAMSVEETGEPLELV